jgi:hypothetical protein
MKTWSMVICESTSAGICSTLSFSPTTTRYCLPPVFMTAYMDVLRLKGFQETRKYIWAACRVKQSWPAGALAVGVFPQDQPLPIAADELEGFLVGEGLGLGAVDLLEAGAGGVAALLDLQVDDLDADRARA